jgi:hypothetical protein
VPRVITCPQLQYSRQRKDPHAGWKISRRGPRAAEEVKKAARVADAVVEELHQPAQESPHPAAASAASPAKAAFSTAAAARPAAPPCRAATAPLRSSSCIGYTSKGSRMGRRACTPLYTSCIFCYTAPGPRAATCPVGCSSAPLAPSRRNTTVPAWSKKPDFINSDGERIGGQAFRDCKGGIKSSRLDEHRSLKR